MEPNSVLPSKERADDASSAVRNSTRAWPLSL